ncbi:MAG: EAL domain-containing protein [Betaproteobacteria bacterium]|nr:EAL domain-containing protein [Betaproteobacteria bacterium]
MNPAPAQPEKPAHPAHPAGPLPNGVPTGLPWLAIALISAAVIGASLAAGWYALQLAQKRITDQMHASAFIKTERLADWHKERLAKAQLLRQRESLARLWLQHQRKVPGEGMALLDRFLVDYAEAPSVQRIELFDATLAQLWDSRGQAAAPHPILNAGLVQVLAQRRAAAVGPWRDAQGRVRLAYVGLIAPPGQPLALVALHVDPPPHFHAALQQWPLPYTRGSARLLTLRDGAVQYWSDLPAESYPVPGFDSELAFAQRLLRGEIEVGQVVRGHDDHGRPALALLQPVAGTDWLVQVEIDRAAVLASARGTLIGVMLFGLLALLLALGGARLLLQRNQLAVARRAMAALQRAQADLSRSEAHYRLLAENATDVVWLYDLEPQRMSYISPSVQRLLGYTSEEREQLTIEQLFEPALATKARQLIASHVQRFVSGDTTEALVIELQHRHRNGAVVPVEISARLLLDAQGQPAQILGVTRDIRARVLAERQLRLLSQATEQSPVAVIVTDAEGQIEYVNPALERISGYRAAEVLGRNPRLLGSQRTPRNTFVQMWDALRSDQTWQGEFINTRKDGSHYHTAVSVAPLRDAAQRVLQYVSVQMDLSAQRAAEQQVELLAWFDPLTGLPNRKRLLAELPQILRQRPGNGEQAGLLIVNVDRFKAINDARGRNLGDAVLLALADRLRLHLNSGEVLAHLSGDEFALLLPHLGHEAPAAASSLLRRAARWHQMLEQPLEAGGERLRITLSVGATLLGGMAAEHPSEALRHADTALHQAQEAGGNQTVFFDPHMGQWAAERFALEQDLRHGIEQGELRLYLQPQVDAQGRTVSAEALVRWQHPQRGLLSPALFIPLAEESGLIEPLGRWMLEQVCGWLGRLQAQGRRLPLSVNISPRQFQQSDFGERLQELLQRSQAQAGDLMLEFTESVVLHDVERVIERMAALARLGLRFSIDDFGTGYSSLSYLKNLPIHELKIDRSFVQDAPHSPSDAALVAAMLAVASLMKLQVVAEGVETEEQSLLFRHHPGALMQGYLFGRPEPAEELIGRWLAQTVAPDAPDAPDAA